MYIRRYYPQGNKYEKTYTDEYFQEMIVKYGIERAINLDNAEYEFVFESTKERKDFLNSSYDKVIQDTNFYLDNLESIPTFSVHEKILTDNITCFTIDGTKIN